MTMARKIRDSTALFTPKVDTMLLGTMLRITLRGLAPVEPLAAARPSMVVLKTPALKQISATAPASTSATTVVIRNQPKVFRDTRPRVAASRMVPIAMMMEVNTIGTMTSCSALTKS